MISNTDQGSQFTSPGFIDAVQSAGVEVSMDGRGRWIDNRFIERLWRSVKYEDVYLNDCGDGLSADRGLRAYFQRYNTSRPHQSLDNATPVDWYRSAREYGGKAATWEAMWSGQKNQPRSPEKVRPKVEWIQENDFLFQRLKIARLRRESLELHNTEREGGETSGSSLSLSTMDLGREKSDATKHLGNLAKD